MPEDQTSIDAVRFREKYGPWAVIAGASDGVGAGFARAVAAAGLNVVLISRRLETLDALARQLQAEFGVQTRTASVDLYEADAAARVFESAAGLEVGLYISNAGASSNIADYVDRPFQEWRALLNRNVMRLAELVHGFAGKMKARGRGGVIIMSSEGALGGAAKVAVYSGTKAFDLVFAESLWIELKPFGVDVLSVVAGAMDTPAFRSVVGARDIPGVLDPEFVARGAVAKLGQGPVCVFGSGLETSEGQIAEARRNRVEAVTNMTKKFFGG
jgi:uncharacterized protein